MAQTVADSAPADRGKPASHKAGGGKLARIQQTIVGYYTLGGMGLSRWDRIDGQIVVASAEDFADTWIVAGKANPSIMRALEIATVEGPFMAFIPLVTLHTKVILTILDRHNANPFKGLFAPVTPARPVPPPGRQSREPEQPTEPVPLPYQPVGPQAPTQAAPPPQYQEADLLVIPDEGIPADLDVALREAARMSGRPYQELRQEALVELAQMRMQQNGHGGRVQTPGALGAPIARE